MKIFIEKRWWCRWICL